MKMLNRNAVIVKPKQPYKDWIASLDDDEPEGEDYEDRDYPVYLLPEAKDDAHFRRILKKRFLMIFENELFGWYEDESAWPQRRDWKTFCAWFEVLYGSEVMDLATEPLSVEEF